MQFDYATALVVIAGGSMLCGLTRRIGAVLILCWIAQMLAVYATGDYAPWRLFAAANIVATCVILRDPATKLGAVIGGTLLVQTLIDCAFGVAANTEMAYQYVTQQTHIAWLQLALLGGWHVGRGVYHGLRYRRQDVGAPYRYGVAGR